MILGVAIAWFLMGLLTWYSFAFAGSTGWYYYWYLWDKSLLLLLFAGLCFDYNKEYKHLFKWLAVFASIRFIWEIISLITGWNVNNTKAVAGLFILLTLTICIILIKELSKWRKQNLRS